MYKCVGSAFNGDWDFEKALFWGSTTEKPECYSTLYKHSFTLYDSCLGSPSKTLQVQICEKKYTANQE